MIPNTIPSNYVRKATLRLPLALENNQYSFWPLLVLTVVLVIALLSVTIYSSSVNVNLFWFLIFLCPIFVLLWLLALLRFVRSPPQNILIESTQITVKSKFRGAKIYPCNTLAYVALYSDRVVSDGARPYLFLFNLGEDGSDNLIAAIINSFIKSSVEWFLLMRLDKTKIVIHIEDDKSYILLDVPTKKLSLYLQDLGLLLGLPVKM